jgi:MinD-like ATPase involved in chromosome partitioning or flagellar assembly|tara:strand:- start:3403 stop:4194 length:792 start_codon:yes stop_codon:yes gene_type:complete
MGKAIGIISIKGGTGKTTSVVNLANILTKIYKQKVLIVDANFSAPNLRLHLGLGEPRTGIHEMLQEIVKPNEAIYSTSYGFNILPAKLNNKKPTKVSSLKEYIEDLKDCYDFILIDSSPNINAEILAAINSSDSLIMIINPDYSSLSCLLNAIKIAKLNKIPIDGLIINKKYNSKNEVSFNDIEKTTGENIIAVIPHHIDIHEAVLKRIPLEINQRKEYSKEYLELAKFMILLSNATSKIKLKNFILKTISQKNRKRILKEKN